MIWYALELLKDVITELEDFFSSKYKNTVQTKKELIKYEEMFILLDITYQIHQLTLK